MAKQEKNFGLAGQSLDDQRKEANSLTGNRVPQKMRDSYVASFLGDCSVKLMNCVIIKGITKKRTDCRKSTAFQQDRKTHNIRVRSCNITFLDTSGRQIFEYENVIFRT